MSQQDYNAPPSEAASQEQKPQFEKKEDVSLPQFTKDVPLRSIIKKHGSNVLIEYEWSVLGGEEIRISMANLRKDESEKLQYVHKIRIKDGQEVGSFSAANTNYVIRKTTEKVAKDLMKTGSMLKDSVLGVIGYFKTVKGNVYAISKAEKGSWALDPRLGLKTFSLNSMNEQEKRKFADLIIEELLKLHRAGYALRKFNLLDVIVTKKKIVLGDMTALVKIGAGRTVDSFLGNLKIMVRSGIAKKEDIVYGIALSFGAMKKEYSEWAKENGMGEADEIAVMDRIEKDVLN